MKYLQEVVKNYIIPNLRWYMSNEAADKSGVHLMETGFYKQRAPNMPVQCSWLPVIRS